MRFDPLIVHYLADELQLRLAGARASAVRVDAASGAAALETAAGTLLLDLHPARGVITLGAAPLAATVLTLPSRCVVARVSAPADERLLVIDLAGAAAARPHRLVVELMTNQWNAIVLDGRGEGPEAGVGGGGRILAVLRARDAGGRRLRPGTTYRPPPPSPRLGLADPLSQGAWVELLGPVPADERTAALIERVAWTSPLNARWILGSAAEANALDSLADANERYRTLAGLPTPAPCLLETARGVQPYPVRLAGVPAAPAPSLLAAAALVAGLPPPPGSAGAWPGASPSPASLAPELRELARRRLTALEARIGRLEAQAAGAREESAELRAQGDVLLAHLHAVRRGMDHVMLPDFAGGEVEIALDPALAPAENAAHLYERARRRERAAARVPALVADVQAQRARLADALAQAERPDASAGADTGSTDVGPRTDAGESAGARESAGAVDELRQLLDRPSRAPGAAPEERLPFRRYRTSGGLEVRVGRSRRDNDELTFHHSAPEDIWLHARDVGGAHVVLRWGAAHAGPPHRDLAEAAVLAALHSRARTSGMVAVDWTRRKYVRKPRKAPPGLVVPERVKTLFVEPDEAVERRLRA